MNFTKKSISIVLFLAFVFTTIVCVSVGASLDFPIHESVVTYNSVNGQNTAKADVIGGGKIAFFNSEKVNQIGSMVTANSSNVKSLVNSAIGSGATIKVDIYAEFTAQSGATTVPARFMFGDEWVEPKTAVSFTHGTLVTAEFKSSDFSVNDLTNSSAVSVKMVPDEDDSVTGSFYASVPYLSGAAQASTVPVTSFRTTTTKATTEYTGKIDIHDTPVTISGKKTGYGGSCEILIGDNDSSNNGKFAYFKSVETSQNQIQGDLYFDGFDELYNQAVEQNKDICFDVYSNDFTTAVANKDGYGFFQHRIGEISTIAANVDYIKVYPNKKKTFSYSAERLGNDVSSMFIQFQQYDWSIGALQGVSLIISAPYLEGADLVKSDYEPETTTFFKPSSDDYLPGGEIAVYNNGVSYKGTQSFYKPTDSAEIGYGKVGNDNKYVTIAGAGVEEWGGYQIQLNSAGLNGLSQLRARAVAADEPLYMDVYCVSTNNPCYFRAGFSGGQTGDKDCKVTAGKKVTLVIPNSIVTSSDSSINITFLNYSEGDKTIKDASFIVSVPYVKEDIDTATKVAVNAPEVPTTTTTTLASINYHDTEGNNSIPLKVHMSQDSDVYFSSYNWANPENKGCISDSKEHKKIAYVTSEEKYGRYQMNLTTSKTDGKSDFGKLILKAKAEGKKVCIDYYGNFNSGTAASSDSYAYIRTTFGGSGLWFGNTDEDKGGTRAVGDDVKDFVKIVPEEVTTVEYDPEKLLELMGDSVSTSKNYEVESIGVVNNETDVTPKTVGSNETFTGEKGNPEYHQFDNVNVGDTIVYSCSSLAEGNYDLIFRTRDYKGAKFDVYINGTKQAKSLDCSGNSKSYQNHYILNHEDGDTTFANDKESDVTVKLVCTKAATDSHALTLDKISFDAVSQDGGNKDSKLAEYFTGMHCHIIYNSQAHSVNYGRFYMSAPYLEGAATEEFTVPTTTTTRPTLTSTEKGESMPSSGWDMSKIDLSYVDCRIPSSAWNGAMSGSIRPNVIVSDDNRYEKISIASGKYTKEIGDCFNINGGKSSIQFSDYVRYAKDCDAWIAVDIFPEYSSTTSCFITTGWDWPKGDKDFMVKSGRKYTYLIHPDDVPEGANTFRISFLNYDNDNGMKDATFYVTAPYIKYAQNTEKTTTTQQVTTASRANTSTYAYPENNQNGSTRFKVLDTQVGIFGEVKVPVAISGNEGLNYANFTIKYNKNDLTFNGVDTTGCSVFDKVYASSKADAKKLGEVNITLEQNAGDTLKNGTIFYLSFETDANENADLISFAGGDGYVASNFFNSNGQNVPCSFTNGYVSIGDATTRITSPDPNDITPYPTTNSGTTKFDISTVSDTYAANKADKEYTVYVSVSGNAGLKGAKFSVKYDDNLQFIGSSVAEDSTVFNRLESVGYNFTPTEKTPGILEYNIYPTNSNVKDSTNNGKIVSITFKLKNYVVGTYPVEFGGLSYDPANFKNVAGTAVPCAFQSGAIKITGAKLATPKVSVKLTKKNVAKVSWKKVANAVSYEVYQSIGSSKSFKKVATTKSTSRTVKKLKLAKKYNFKVKAIGNDATSAFSAVKSITPLNHKTKVVIKSVKSSKKATVKVTLKKKVAGANGYQIRYANNSKFKGAKKATTKTLTKTIKKLASKTYYFKARTFNKVNGKTKFGKWSKVKKVKVK